MSSTRSDSPDAANDQREDYNRSVWAERYATALGSDTDPSAGVGQSSVGSAAGPAAASSPGFEEQHEKNLHILRLIRDEPAWALTRILRCEKLEAALETLGSPHERLRIDQGRGLTDYIREALKP